MKFINNPYIKSSGKSCLLKGIEKREKGVLFQAVEDLLNLIEISVESFEKPQKHKEKQWKLLASVYFVYKNETFDLLSKQKITVIFFVITYILFDK